MKRFRILFIGLVVLAMLATTGCIFGDPSKEILGTWVSDTNIDGNPLTITMTKGYGGSFAGIFGYSFNVNVTWGTYTYNIVATEGAAASTMKSIKAPRSTRAGEFQLCAWIGVKDDSWGTDDNGLAMWYYTSSDPANPTYDVYSFDFLGYLNNDGKLHATYVTLEDVVKIDSGDGTLPAEITFTKN